MNVVCLCKNMASEAASRSSDIALAHTPGDDDLLSSASTESRSATPEDLIVDTISRPLALCLATVFEELADKLALVGYSLATPFVDVRTRQSIEIGQREQRPGISEAVVSDLNEEEEWTLRQHHASVIPRRLDYLINTPPDYKPSAADLMKRSGVKTTTQSERNQKVRIQLHLMANAMVTELVLESSFNSLKQRIREENIEKEAMMEQCRKVSHNKDYIREIKAAIKETKRAKIAEKTAQTLDIYNLTDLLLEQKFRSTLEDKYARKLGAAKVGVCRKYNLSLERLVMQGYRETEKRLNLEYQVHESMMKIIRLKLKETTDYLDATVEKYDKDFTRLTADLEAMCKARRRDLERIKWLQKRIVDYERVVMDNRRLLKREADKARKRLIENKRATKIQAWWRGIMVRKWLGSYAKKFSDLIELKLKKAEARANQRRKPGGRKN